MHKELTPFSEYPNLQGSNPTFAGKIAVLFITYIYIFLALIIVAGPITLIAETLVVHVFHLKSIRDQNTSAFQHLMEKKGQVFTLIYICVIGPVIEEVVFRLPLSFKRRQIALGLAFGTYIFSSLLPIVHHPAKGHAFFIFSGLVIICIAVYFVAAALIPKNIDLSSSTKKWIIITSILLFGLMHISNYSPLQWSIIWIYPAYIVPQLLMGWGITYVRFKNGFIWGIAMHCLINSVSMLLAHGKFVQSTPVKTNQEHIIKKQDQTKNKVSTNKKKIYKMPAQHPVNP